MGSFHFNHIYLYGAGRYGKLYLEALQAEGICVSAFITTQYEQSTYCGLPVYVVSDISPSITEEDWVILAYKGANPQEVGEKFCHIRPQIIYYDSPTIRRLMRYEAFFTPIVKELRKQFPSPAPLKNYPLWQSLLVIRLDAIGDVVCTTAFIRELRRNYPRAEFTVVVRKETYPLLKDCPYIDNLISYEGFPSKGEFIEDWKDVEVIQKKVSAYVSERFMDIHFDAVFLPTEILCGRNGVEEFLLALYSKANCRIGHVADSDEYRRWIYDVVKSFFSKVVYQTKPMHETLFQLDMLKECGLDVANDKTELWINEDSRKKVESLLKKKGVDTGDIVIAVGVVGSINTRSWSTGNYSILFQVFYKKYGGKVKFIIFGGRDAIGPAEELEENGASVINLAGRLSLDDSVACMQKCDAYIGSNTGLLHIADALDKPSVTIYAELADGSAWDGGGPTRYGARKGGKIDLIPPAGLDGCHVFCRKPYSHCINQISPDQVGQAIEEILNRKSG